MHARGYFDPRGSWHDRSVQKLRTKLLVGWLGVLLPLLAVAGFLTWQSARRQLEAELGLRLAGIAQTTAIQMESFGDGGRVARLEADSVSVRTRLEEQLRRVRDGNGLRRVRIIDSELRSLVDTEQVAAFEPYFELQADEVEIARAFESGRAQSSVLYSAVDGQPYKRGYAPLSDDGAVVALVVVDGSASYTGRIRRLGWLMAGVSAVLILLTTVMTLWLSHRITEPLTALSAAADRIGGGDLSSPVQRARADEIGDLSSAVERMRMALLERDEERQMMLAGIAHEIRNPLGGMEIFVALLEEELQGDGRSVYAHKVRRELNYLKRVVEEFLAYARDSAYESTRFGAEELLAEACESCGGIAVTRGVLITTEVEPGLELSGDYSALRGVLQNVVQNALQASDEGASVRVSVTASGAGSRQIDVSDSGAGMAPEVVAQVWRPFYTTREKGTGLGLPLARKVIRDHGGDVDITSDVGVGTRVCIRLPFDDGAPLRSAAGARLSQMSTGDYDGEMIG